MIKVFTTKAFILFTLLFVTIAISSFIAFRETEVACTGVKKCSGQQPAKKGGEILWDVFSRQLVSLVSLG